MKILVVDDSATQRLIIKSIIKNFNSDLDVLEMADGTQALIALNDGGVKLVFSDINMEPMSGIELFEKSRNLAELPIFAFVTSHLTDNMKSKAIELGLDYFLTKPIDKDRVEEILLEVFHD